MIALVTSTELLKSKTNLIYTIRLFMNANPNLFIAEKTISLRDVYYTLKQLFRNQMEANNCILIVGRMLNMKRCK